VRFAGSLSRPVRRRRRTLAIFSEISRFIARARARARVRLFGLARVAAQLRLSRENRDRSSHPLLLVASAVLFSSPRDLDRNDVTSTRSTFAFLFAVFFPCRARL